VVQIAEGAQFVPELCLEPKPMQPNRAKIKAPESRAGVPGASLLKHDRLQIS